MDNKKLETELEKINEKSSIIDLQKYVNDMIKVRGFENETPKDIMLLLTEEIGELAREIRKLSGIKMDIEKEYKTGASEEIADVFIYILSMCKVLNIDLLEAFKNKEKINLKRTWK